MNDQKYDQKSSQINNQINDQKNDQISYQINDQMMWEDLFRSKIREIATAEDPAHDLLHFERVVKMAKRLCQQENGNLNIVLPAAWLHDLVIIPKNDHRRSQASRLSAVAAAQFLQEQQYPKQYIPEIMHAIEGHSFSADIRLQSLEAKIVQDADRLDAIGAIGIARCFATAGILKTSFYSNQDPFCLERSPNDLQFTVDHFYKKLFLLVERLNTSSAKQEGILRIEKMHRFLSDLKAEIE